MSTESYAKWWIKVRKEFQDLRGYEDALEKMGTIKDPLLLDQIVGGLFARYSLIVQQLDSCLDQLLQVQKNETIQKLMDAAAMRLFELKNDLLEINISEYHYIDGALVELKLIPHSVEIIHPTYVYSRHHELEDFWTRVKKGETIYIPPPPPEPGEEVIGDPANPDAPVDPLAMLLATSSKKQKDKKVLIETPDEQKKTDEEKKPEDEKKPEEEEPQIEETPAEARKRKRKEKRKEKEKKARPKGFVIDISEMTEEEINAMKKKERMLEALNLIQTHERGRQCRLYFNDMHMEFAARKALAVPGAEKPQPVDPEVKLAAVQTIQAAYRGYRARKIMKIREVQRRLLIGMVRPSYRSMEEFETIERNLEKRRAIREQHIKEYIQAHLDEKARVLRVRAPGLFEDIGDEIRWWFEDWYRNTDTFQEIPPPAKGGTILVIRGETQTIKEYQVEKLKKGKDKKKSKEQIAKEKAKAKELKRKEKEKKKKAAEIAKRLAAKKKAAPYEFKVEKTQAHEKYEEGENELREIWDNIDDAKNPLGKHYTYMITDEKCYEMQLEVREQVDEMMRMELELLQIANQKDAWLRKGGKGKFKPKKKKKPKKGKKGKKKKKDPTGHRKVEDLFQELVNEGIIRTYPEAHIRDYSGDFSYQNWEQRLRLYDPPATLGDVRAAVVINCILPLGALKMNRPKSALIVGARQSGKHLLANAIFNETRCVLFDLTPKVVAGKYPGAKGKKMLVHLVTKMARILQPSIIFVDGAEQPFYKKVPKEEKEFEPKRVGKYLKPILKFITPADKIMLLGITGKPWAGQFGSMKKSYQKIILIPRTDYGSAFLYWNEILMPYQGVDRNFNISILALATINYPLSELRNAAETVLAARRLIQLSFKPLLHSELQEALLQGNGPVTDKEYKKFDAFYRKTPLGKKRVLQNALNELARAKGSKGGKR